MGLGRRIANYFGFMEERSPLQLPFDSEWLNYANSYYQLQGSSTLGEKEEPIGQDYEGLVQGAFKADSIVFACMVRRQQLFSEARFQFRQFRQGKPGDLFGTTALAPLEKPWPGGTTADLLAKVIQDVDLAGNAFLTLRKKGIQRLRPDWMTIVLGGDTGIDYNAELLGYLYHPGGKRASQDPVVLRPENVAHFAPIPDPAATYRGMSWITPIIREVMGDKASTTHKLKFFENGATPNLIVTMDPTVKLEAAKRWKELFIAENEGLDKAYETLFLGGGASADVVGANLRQIDFAVTQGAGEVRIAAAAGVPAIIVGLSEGIKASTYSNFGQAQRVFADGTLRPLWRNLAGSLENIIPTPAGAQLWYDDSDIPFIQEDQKDVAASLQQKAATINTLITAGFTPDSIVNAVSAGDLKQLIHTGMTSVQLLPPGEQQPTNGSGNGKPNNPPVPMPMPSGTP